MRRVNGGNRDVGGCEWNMRPRGGSERVSRARDDRLAIKREGHDWLLGEEFGVGCKAQSMGKAKGEQRALGTLVAWPTPMIGRDRTRGHS